MTQDVADTEDVGDTEVGGGVLTLHIFISPPVRCESV